MAARLYAQYKYPPTRLTETLFTNDNIKRLSKELPPLPTEAIEKLLLSKAEKHKFARLRTEREAEEYVERILQTLISENTMNPNTFFPASIRNAAMFSKVTPEPRPTRTREPVHQASGSGTFRNTDSAYSLPALTELLEMRTD